jgi:hypothetical protein
MGIARHRHTIRTKVRNGCQFFGMHLFVLPRLFRKFRHTDIKNIVNEKVLDEFVLDTLRVTRLYVCRLRSAAAKGAYPD